MIKDIFEIKKVKGRPIENYNNGLCPYISTSSNNNGLIGFVKGEKSEISEGNCISVDPIKGISFYHKYDFIGRGFSGASINLLYNKELNQYSYLFLCKAIEITAKYKASYGNLFNSYRLSNAKILLPADDLGNPDYKFMEDFIKEREKSKREKYRKYVESVIKTLDKNGDFREREILNKKWKEFFIQDIFYINGGKRLEAKNMIPGKIPFIGAVDSNNGITNYIDNMNKSFDKNVLGVNYDGNGMVISFYHQYNCLFSDSVKRLHFKEYDDTKFGYLFSKTVLLQQKPKYNYGYKFNEYRMKRQKIMLPVTENEEIDYKFMENYMKYLMLRKYQKYLDY